VIEFLRIYEDIEKQLGRKLKEKEKHFLEWVYDRYRHEECELKAIQ